MDTNDGLLFPTMLILMTLAVVHFASYNLPLIGGEVDTWQKTFAACSDTTCIMRNLSTDTRQRISLPLDKPLKSDEASSKDWSLIKEAFSVDAANDPPMFYQRMEETTLSMVCDGCQCAAKMLVVVENFTWSVYDIEGFQCQCE
jgi:hypothetical protein